jgi:hypothetical protein
MNDHKEGSSCMKHAIFTCVQRPMALALALLCALSCILLFQPGMAHAAGTVTINYSSVVNNSVSPLLFGGSNEPWPSQDASVYPQLQSIGVKFERGTIHVDVILPKNITLSDYQNNVNNVQDPNTWDWTALSWATNAHSRGIITMANLFQAPAWLTHNGAYNGVPSNWSVWQDIVKKIYTRYQSQLNYIEILNEPGGFLSIAGSPYTSNAAAADDYYYYTEQAIRSVSTSVKLGGDADAHVGGSFGDLGTILGDRRLGSNAINFVSYHIYSTNPPNNDQIGAMTTLLNNNGRSGLPIFITEWNYSLKNSADPHVSGIEAVPFVGASFLEFMQQPQLSGATYFSLLPNNVNLNQYEDCNCTSNLAFYHWANNQATLLPQTYAYQVASQDLGLGAGTFKVYSTSVAGITSALGGLNSHGNAVAMLVNDSSSATTTSVSFTNIATSGSHTVAVYTAVANGGTTNNGLFPTKVLTGQSFTNKSYTISVSLPAYSFVGVTIDGNTTGGT